MQLEADVVRSARVKGTQGPAMHLLLLVRRPHCLLPHLRPGGALQESRQCHSRSGDNWFHLVLQPYVQRQTDEVQGHFQHSNIQHRRALFLPNSLTAESRSPAPQVVHIADLRSQACDLFSSARFNAF